VVAMQGFDILNGKLFVGRQHPVDPSVAVMFLVVGVDVVRIQFVGGKLICRAYEAPFGIKYLWVLCCRDKPLPVGGAGRAIHNKLSLIGMFYRKIALNMDSNISPGVCISQVLRWTRKILNS